MADPLLALAGVGFLLLGVGATLSLVAQWGITLIPIGVCNTITAVRLQRLRGAVLKTMGAHA